jgi:hypothetical protein
MVMVTHLSTLLVVLGVALCVRCGVCHRELLHCDGWVDVKHVDMLLAVLRAWHVLDGLHDKLHDSSCPALLASAHGDGDTSKHAAGGARSGTVCEMWGVPSQTAAL